MRSLRPAVLLGTSPRTPCVCRARRVARCDKPHICRRIGRLRDERRRCRRAPSPARRRTGRFPHRIFGLSQSGGASMSPIRAETPHKGFLAAAQRPGFGHWAGLGVRQTAHLSQKRPRVRRALALGGPAPPAPPLPTRSAAPFAAPPRCDPLPGCARRVVVRLRLGRAHALRANARRPHPQRPRAQRASSFLCRPCRFGAHSDTECAVCRSL